ncbi:unknown similar to AMEV224 [Mythimna separata entomopoxvirus 'L']|uniref:Uncharacterized protein n=1 Tax=Mythimna separata entomopoxvirus 'L' TaxID=1293572 RepID=A0A916KQC8_9POXV|nr:unknown similar to AMEV224 [Mythimna separata entomopoxvirus 'L']CCU56443.1 unknown similar to AMEV224 [Mythimna separata entomopoxvirus 'L']
MDKLNKFKELLSEYIENDLYMSDAKINNVELHTSLNDDFEYFCLILRISNRKFTWEKLPYPDQQNIQFVLDRFQKYNINNFKLFNCEVLYKLNYDDIEGLWVVKYKFIEDYSNVDNSSDNIYENTLEDKDAIEEDKSNEILNINTNIENNFVDVTQPQKIVENGDVVLDDVKRSKKNIKKINILIYQINIVRKIKFTHEKK